MEPHNLNASVKLGVLFLSWTVPDTPVATCISVATDPEFTSSTLRTFVLPVVSACGIDIGTGTWFARIGAWYGSPTQGIIKWSGIMGPITIITEHPVIPPISPSVAIVHSSAIVGGVRIHTGSSMPRYAVCEYSTDEKFPASNTHWIYTFDVGRGYFDCTGPTYPHTYAIRTSMFSKDAELPKDEMKQLTTGLIVKGKAPGRRSAYTDSISRTMHQADAAILHEGQSRTNMKFSTHADYLRYKAAFTRASEEVKRDDRPVHYK